MFEKAMPEYKKSQTQLRAYTGGSPKTEQVWEVWTSCGGTLLIQ